jgi:hypothetical protein
MPNSPTIEPASTQSVSFGPRTRPRYQGLEDWRRAKATEALRDSFDDRLAQRVEPTKERLIAEAEARIGTRLIFGPSGPDGNVAIARPLSEMLAEAETGQETEPAEDVG